MAKAVLTISSKNYSSWSLRGWLMTRFSGLPFTEKLIPPENAAARAEILLLAPSILVPCLTHGSVVVWDTMAIAEYLNEVRPTAGMFPKDRVKRARCRSICGEMHSGFSSLRSALPMNLKAHFPRFNVWARAQADIDRVLQIWAACFKASGGPFLFGKLCVADLMYAPVVTRLKTYNVPLDKVSTAYCERIMALPDMRAWIAAAKLEADDIDELEAEF
jgi:glutathione S-transferase